MSNDRRLTKSQALAIEHIGKHAISRKTEAKKSINEILQLTNLSGKTLEDAVSKIRLYARVALHFHPDRPVEGLKSILMVVRKMIRLKKVLLRTLMTY